MPDLAPTFSAREEDLTKNVGVLTRILDGQGYESDSGTHGHRGYTGDYRFSLLAATTPLTAAAWRTMARLGNRILVLDVGSEQVATDDLVASMRGEVSYQENVRACTEAVGGLLLRLWKDTGGYGSIQWDSTADDESLLTVIALVAQWVVRCRGTVTLEADGESYSTVHVESPYRLVNGLYSMAKGHAVAAGRTVLAREDVQFAVRVALDSMPVDRRRLVRALIASTDGQLTTAVAATSLDQSRPTARKAMAELDALGAVSFQEGKGQIISFAESEMWLSEEAFRWVTSRLP